MALLMTLTASHFGSRWFTPDTTEIIVFVNTDGII
jgi:hypothetical protein